MTSSWRSGIDRFNRGLAGTKKLPTQVCELVEDVIRDDAKASFAAGQTPYGTPWRPRKVEPRDGHPLLDETGALKGSLNVKANGNRVVVSYDDKKAGFHNEGTDRLPVRRLVPYDGRLPARWVEAIKAAFKKTVGELFK